jgi:hypothetical protein
MSTAGTPQTDGPTASDIAARLREAGLVRLVAAGTGDGVAATGLLVDALDQQGVAYQTSVVALPDRSGRATSADLTVSLGRPATEADLTLGTDGTTASAAAFAVARALAPRADHEAGADHGAGAEHRAALALAGPLAAGREPGERVLAAVDLEQRPGVAVPVADTAAGLAHSTLVHAPFSGSVPDTAERLAGLSEDRAVASAVALAVAGDEAGVPRGAEAVERVLRPHVGGPFETVGGYADVLDALARERPGHAVAAALGADLSVLEVWRDHAERAHAAVSEARTGRYDGLFVARCDGPAPVGTVARLVRDYRSPEPVALAVADGEAAMYAVPDAPVEVGTAVETAARAVDGEGAGTRVRGRARFDVEPSAFVLEAREAV